MKNERGEVKLVTIIGIVLILTVILFAVVVYSKITEDKSVSENIANDENTVQTNTIDNVIENNVIEENEILDNPTIVDTKMENFSMKFLQLENNKQNMLYSPLSIKYALKMLQEGAEGETYNQINKVIGNLNLTTYKNIDEKLSLANGVFIRDKYSATIKNNYIDTLATKYNAELKYDSFESATNVNKWIEEKTLGIIKNMISDDIVQNPYSTMLLINALAIDMEWKSGFSFDSTYGEEFILENGQKMIATTMNKETSSEDTSYYIGNDVTVLTMDLEKCEDTELEFMAIMPDSDLKQYVDELTINKIDEITNKLVSASKVKDGIIVQIPKFKFDYNLKLKQDLQNMGITDAFDREKANFSKIKTDDIENNLYVGSALHKADIDFSEEGIKAAAVTVFGMMYTESIEEPKYPQEVKIDKPFLFLIRDKNTKEVWFTGTVYEPNAWENDKAEYEEKY